jgi:hypothetical protein
LGIGCLNSPPTAISKAVSKTTSKTIQGFMFMKRKNVFSAVVSLGIILPVISTAHVAIAQGQDILRLADSYSARIGFVPPADDGAPRSTRSGASRRPFPQTCGTLPLLPENGLGLTTDEQFSLYAYFAKGSTVNKVMINVTSADQSEYYETSVNLPVDKFAEKGGVIKVEPTETLPTLKTDEEYSWSIVLMCDGQIDPRPDSPVLTGAVKRVAPILTAQSGDISLMEQAKMYGDAGVWHNLLSTLALMRIETPENEQAKEHWTEVLASVGLDNIADADLVLP